MTREEKIELLEKEKTYMLSHGGDRQAIALDSAIKALEQESVIDRIRTEIEALDIFYDSNYFSGNRDAMFKCNDILQIIDKYKAERREVDG